MKKFCKHFVPLSLHKFKPWTGSSSGAFLLPILLERASLGQSSGTEFCFKTRTINKWRHCDCEVRGHCMCKELPVVPVNRVVDKKRIIRKNGGRRSRSGTRGRWPQKTQVTSPISTFFLQSSLEQEHRQYNDLVQHNFIDSFVNLTLKTTFLASISQNSISAEKTFRTNFYPQILDKVPPKDNIYMYSTTCIFRCVDIGF
jgi:hypothetical protein